MTLDHRIHQVSSQQILNLNKIKQNKPINKDFKTLLEEQELKISKHASERLKERNITIDKTQWQTINEKLKEAKQKGVTDSLVVLSDAALVVSAKNNTVVTAMNVNEARNRIFTNINGTILLNYNRLDPFREAKQLLTDRYSLIKK